MKLSKNEIIVLILGGGIFGFLSYLLHGYVSLVHPYCDVDSSAYLRNGFLFYKYTNFSPTHAPQLLPAYGFGYPFFIGMLYKFLGPSSLCVIWLQVFLSMLSGVVLFFTARRLWGSFVAYVTYSFWCINIGFLVFSHFLLTEILLSSFYIVFFERFTNFLSSGRTAALLAAGFMLGCSIVIKPAALYFVFFLIPLLYFFKTAYIKNTIVFMLSFCAPIMMIMMHNKVVFDKFEIGALDSVNIYYWFYPNVLAHKNGTTSDFERSVLQAKDFEVVRYNFSRDIQQTPMLFCYIWMKNVFKTWVGLFTTNLKVLVNQHVGGGEVSFFKVTGSIWHRCCEYITHGAHLNWIKFVGVFEALWLILRLIFVFLGLLTLIWLHQYELFFFIGSYLFYFSMITGHDGCARFRMLFEFILIMIAALGVQALYKMVCRKLKRLGNEERLFRSFGGRKW